MRRLFCWPVIIIALGLGLWAWQWQATRRLSQRAVDLTTRLKAASAGAPASPAKAALAHAAAQPVAVPGSGMDRLKVWQQRNAAVFSEMTGLRHQWRALNPAGDEAATAPLAARMRELQEKVNAMIESDDAARVMFDAFLEVNPTARDANGEVSLVAEILGHRLLENQPGALLDLQTPGRADLGVVAALARVVEMDPAHANSWMRADATRMTNPDLLKLWLGGLAAHDPASALAALDGITAIDLRAALAGIPAVASHLRTNDERLILLKHCAAEPDVARRTELVQAVLGKVSTFAEASDLFTGLELPGTAKDQIAAGIATRNLTDDPASRGDWLLGQTTAEGRPEALRQFVTSWTRADYNAAGRWLGKLPAGPDRDTAVADFAGLIRDLDPEAALSWASVVSDPALRQHTLEKVRGIKISPD